MESYTVCKEKQALFVGIDVHKRTYHVTGVWGDGREEFTVNMPSEKEILVRYLKRWGLDRVIAVCELATNHFTSMQESPRKRENVLCFFYHRSTLT